MLIEQLYMFFRINQKVQNVKPYLVQDKDIRIHRYYTTFIKHLNIILHLFEALDFILNNNICITKIFDTII